MLFTLPKVQMKKVLDDYAKRAPAPLNLQFPDRRGKEEVVQAYKVRKQKKMKTPLHPPGKFGVCCNVLLFPKFIFWFTLLPFLPYKIRQWRIMIKSSAA